MSNEKKRDFDVNTTKAVFAPQKSVYMIFNTISIHERYNISFVESHEM